MIVFSNEMQILSNVQRINEMSADKMHMFVSFIGHFVGIPLCGIKLISSDIKSTSIGRIEEFICDVCIFCVKDFESIRSS